MFRKVDRWGNVAARALEPSAVNRIVKQRAQMAGLDAREFSAHGLRSGYLTEAANRGIPLPEAMEQSRHRSVQQASDYYNNAKRRSGRHRDCFKVQTLHPRIKGRTWNGTFTLVSRRRADDMALLWL